MLLTKEERQRFIEYCNQHVEDSDKIIEQLQKLPGPHTEVLAERERRKAMAYLIVGADLEIVEED